VNVNDYIAANRGMDGYSWLTPRIYCADGFHLSVQASDSAYCSPRYNEGPWCSVEVGFPSAVPELILSYAEDDDNPLGTVYGYVPVELVDELVALHGGIANTDGARLEMQP